MNTPAPLPPAELRAIRDELVAKPFHTDDLLKIEEAIERRHHALLNLKDPSQPWSGDNRAAIRPLIVIAGFRHGKTYSLSQAISRLQPIETPDGPMSPRPLQINAPEHFTIEALGRTLLSHLNLLPARSLGPSRTIERLHTRLRLKRPTIVHIDEAQRMLTPDRGAQHRREEEQKKIFGQLRSLVDLGGWPVLLVLSGTMELAKALERHDLGFFRDIADVIMLTPLQIGNEFDCQDLKDALNAATEKVGMTFDAGATEDFFNRLILAANFARGLAFDICHEAVLLAAEARRKVVTVEDFETFYARKAGCLSAGNPFAARDWHRIDPKALLAGMSGDEAPKVGELSR